MWEAAQAAGLAAAENFTFDAFRRDVLTSVLPLVATTRRPEPAAASPFFKEAAWATALAESISQR